MIRKRDFTGDIVDWTQETCFNTALTIIDASTVEGSPYQNYVASNDIVVTGVRHGEKWHEKLLTNEESMIAKELDSFYRIPADHRELNYSHDYVSEGISPYLDSEYSSCSARRLQISDIKSKLLTLDCIQEAMGNGGRNCH
ncbi:polysaccharide biosynthesis protein [Cohnella abietis]|uniref:Uncharacterized protein n=1 Tax=Cohnella abietis TaxID=2507935 RepID=A0A3T1DC90_9BACL|nr:polysaccharide biosynthesis protein [Cohnella abietis]BBI35654.1 hypothetical protein KCTCHS21_50530 [Cohnella abietis]